MNSKSLAHRVGLFFFTSALILLSSCQSTPELSTSPEATEFAPEVTLERPTETQLPPTEAPTVETIPTPEGQIFRDDFDDTFDPSWIIFDENPVKWAVVDGDLQLTAEDPSLLIQGSQTNLFWQEIPSGSFEISVHVIADTTSNFQQAAIFIYQDQENYVTINRGFCDLCPTGGDGIYMDYKLAGSFGGFNVPVSTDDVYLRLVSDGSQIIGYYALQPDVWERLGRVGNYLQAGYVGLGVSNSDGGGQYNDDLIAFFDYFEITTPK